MKHHRYFLSCCKRLDKSTFTGGTSGFVSPIDLPNDLYTFSACDLVWYAKSESRNNEALKCTTLSYDVISHIRIPIGVGPSFINNRGSTVLKRNTPLPPPPPYLFDCIHVGFGIWSFCGLETPVYLHVHVCTLSVIFYTLCTMYKSGYIQ